MDRPPKLVLVQMQDGECGHQTNANFKENGAPIGRDQGSDRAEVRALVAALEQSIGGIEVITDN
eukprot:3177531-Heterocapsa_arctica.AAC.1